MDKEMTHTEFSKALIDLGWKRNARAAYELVCSESHVSRMKNGHIPVPTLIERYVRCQLLLRHERAENEGEFAG